MTGMWGWTLWASSQGRKLPAAVGLVGSQAVGPESPFLHFLQHPSGGHRLLSEARGRGFHGQAGKSLPVIAPSMKRDN